MSDDTILPFSFPAVVRKKITAAFDGRRLTSDGGVMPSRREVVRLSTAMVDIYCASYPHPPRAVTLDIDDTVDVVHGYQQLSLFNAHYDERCFQPIHVYDTATSRPVAFLLRPGKTPSGVEIL